MNSVRFRPLLWIPLWAILVTFPCLAAEELTDSEEEERPVVADTGGKFEVLDSVFDFGVLREGDVETVSHVFKFKNSGSGKLLITKIEPSCACTKSVASATDLAPGQEATLTADMTLEGKIGDSSATILVVTNDPSHPLEFFTFKGTVLVPWRVVPAQLDLGDIGKGETKEGVLQVQSQYFEGEPHRRITSLRSDHPAVQAATQESEVTTVEAAKKYFDVKRPVRVRVDAGGGVGKLSAKLFISTDDPRGVTQVVEVRWNVEGDLALSTKRVIVRKSGDKSVPTNLSLKSRSGTSFEVLSIESKSRGGVAGDLVITPLDSNSPAEKVFRIEVSDQVKPGRPNLGEITIVTNHPEQPELTLPYTASYFAPRAGAKTSK